MGEDRSVGGSRWWRPLDGLGIALALVVGYPSLLYPLGPDQALFSYIGSGWLEGLWPYVDAMDHKPPGIFYVHAVLAAGFGSASQSAIRLLEWLALPALGWVIAAVVVRSGRLRDGDVGAASLILAGLYFTCFDYWDSGQVEFWEGALLLAAWGIAVRVSHPTLRPLLAGALSGLAFSFKFPALVVAFGVAVIASRRDASGGPLSFSAASRAEWKGRLTSVALFGAGAIAAIGLVLAPFALRGDLPMLWTALVDFNLHYAEHARNASAWHLVKFVTEQAWFYWLALWIAAALALWGRGSRIRPTKGTAGIECAVLFLLGLASVALQGKYFPYHYGVVVPFFAAAFFVCAHQIIHRPAVRLAAAALLVALGIAFAPAWPSNPSMNYRTHGVRAWQHLRGDLSRDEYLAPFTGVDRYRYQRLERIGTLIRSNAQEGDTLCVNGFEPAIYVVAGLRCPSPFFAVHLLWGSYNRSFEDGLWVQRHRRVLAENPPTFRVVTAGPPLERLKENGYRAIAEIDGWFVLERDRGIP